MTRAEETGAKAQAGSFRRKVTGQPQRMGKMTFQESKMAYAKAQKWESMNGIQLEASTALNQGLVKPEFPKIR